MTERKTERKDTEASTSASESETPPEAPDPERAFGRIAEDEALRRNLDDATFGPLLDLFANLAIARAERFDSTDALYSALRRAIVGAADYARSGRTAGLGKSFSALLTDEEAGRVRSSLAASDSPQARAASLARSVARAAGIEEAAT